MWPPRVQEYEKSCVNCHWFMFNPKRTDKFGVPVKMNRECCYEGSVELKGGVCRMWKDARTLMQKLKGIKIKKSFC